MIIVVFTVTGCRVLPVVLVMLLGCCLVVNSVGIWLLYSFWFDLLYGSGLCLVVWLVRVFVVLFVVLLYFGCYCCF